MSVKAGPTTIGMCNAGADELHVWLEPWCDEFELPSRSELLLRVEAEEGIAWEPEFEMSDGSLVIYAAGATRMRILIDDIEQRSGSAMITVPGGPLSTRAFVDVIFDDIPEARPHGRLLPQTIHRLKRLFGRA